MSTPKPSALELDRIEHEAAIAALGGLGAVHNDFDEEFRNIRLAPVDDGNIDCVEVHLSRTNAIDSGAPNAAELSFVSPSMRFELRDFCPGGLRALAQFLREYAIRMEEYPGTPEPKKEKAS